MSKKLLNLTTTLQNCFKPKSDSGQKRELKTRKLQIDTLEERQMLSISPAGPVDIQINQIDLAAVLNPVLYPNAKTQALAGNNQSSSSNNWGDFVTTWAQSEPAWIRDANGVPLIDPTTGSYIPYMDPVAKQPVMESNIYARYFTDEVQRVTLPMELLAPDNGVSKSTFSMQYGGNVVQRLTFSTALAPLYNSSSSTSQMITGTFRIGGIKAHGENQPVSPAVMVNFSEYLGAEYNAKVLQAALRGLGPYMSDVVVRPISAREFDIEFTNSYWRDRDVPELKIENQAFSTGFMAGAMITTVSTPLDITLRQYDYLTQTYVGWGIPVYTPTAQQYNYGNIATLSETWKTNPYWVQATQKTGDAIIAAFRQYWIDNWEIYAPIHTSGRYRDSFGIQMDSFPAPDVGVTVINPWTYEITFINSSGKINHPELLVTSAIDAKGKEYIDPDSIWLYDYYTYCDTATILDVRGVQTGTNKPVRTVKESSDTFRVNPQEIPDPWMPGSGTTKQYKPAVAMDADGEFVIAWEQEVNTPTLNRWNVCDIYAQRFTLQAVLPVDNPNLYRPDGKVIQGVRPVGDVILVNETLNCRQTDPTVASDKWGNFVVGWTRYGQDGSYFNTIQGRWFDRFGNAMTGEIDISHEKTDTPHLSHAAMSDDGYTVIAWNETATPGDIYKSVFLPEFYKGADYTNDPQSYRPAIDAVVAVGRAYQPSIAFDSNNRYLFTWTTPSSWAPGTPERNLLDVGQEIYGAVYMINPPGSDSPETVERAATRLSSVDLNGGILRTHFNRSQQLASSAGIDADGDIFVTYQGYLPDADSAYSRGYMGTISFSTTNQYYYEHFKNGKNADLIAYMAPELGWSYNRFYFDDEEQYYYSSSHPVYDPDSMIREALIYAIQRGATQEQLGRITVIYESIVRNLRNGSIGLSSLDADLRATGEWTIGYNYSDSSVSNFRDGNNQKFIIAVPAYLFNGGNLNLDIYRYDDLVHQEGVNIALVTTGADGGYTLNVGETAKNIRETFDNAWIFGGAYSTADADYRGPTCIVQSFLSDDLQAMRAGTPWEFDNFDTLFRPYGYRLSSNSYWCFEITLIGGAHDTNFNISYNEKPGEINLLTGWKDATTPEFTKYENPGGIIPRAGYGSTPFIDEARGNPGTGQMSPVTLVSKSGDYSVVWAQESRNVYSTSDYYGYYYGDVGYIGYYGYGSNMSFSTYYDWAGIRGTSRDFPAANLYFRHFVESKDTAGPTVTDFLLPDGTAIKDGDLVTSALKQLIVVFDEEMRDISRDIYNGIDNLKNWTLLKDGVEVRNGIESIIFGLNASQPWAQNAYDEAVRNGTLSLGTSKWEAILTFNELSVNGALSTGQYEIIVQGTLADIAGNVYGRDGLNPNGREIRFFFEVFAIDGYLGFDEEAVDDRVINPDEHIGNSSKKDDGNPHVIDGEIVDLQDGKQFFREDNPRHYPVDPDMEPSGTTVASDAEGNFAVVWVSADQGNEGIYLRKYRTYTTYGPGGTTEVEDTIDIIRLSSNKTATHPAVAMDSDGDIIVVWSEENTVKGVSGNRDVYFNYVTERNGRLVTTFANGQVANNYQDDIQQHPAVAMSVQGDFVITWESWGQDGDGWGIFGQRFAPDCSRLGGANCIQNLIFTGLPSGGTFALEFAFYDNNTNTLRPQKSREIKVYQNTFVMEKDIQAALDALEIEVKVQVVSMSRIMIEFVGAYGNQPQPQLRVVDKKNFPRYTDVDTVVSVAGTSGEFLINLETEYDQRFPSVAMAPQGDFVVSWTGWSLGEGTSGVNADVYARKFVSNSMLRLTGSQTNMQTSQTNGTPLIVSLDNPDNHIVRPGEQYGEYGNMVFDGVCRIDTLSPDGEVLGFGSGSLLTTGFHVLTAAHVVTDAFGNAMPISELLVTFHTPTGIIEMGVAEVIVHPTYQGTATFDSTSDIAILQLKEIAPANVQRYEIYRERDELGKTVTKVGYGNHAIVHADPMFPPTALELWDVDYLKRWGLNTYDITSWVMDPSMHPEILMYDFDDGSTKNDYFGNRFGVRHTGTGLLNEVMTAKGDSGGPGFVDGKIAGVTSGGHFLQWGDGYSTPAGSYAWDVRVSGYVDWIDAILTGGGRQFRVNQTTTGNQLWSDVAMDASGSFVVTWTHAPSSVGILQPDAYAIYARRFDADGNPLSVIVVNEEGDWIVDRNVLGGEFLVSSTAAANSKDQHQLMSKIAMTPKGDFVIAWEGLSNRSNPDGFELDFEIFARRYVNNRSLLSTVVGFEVDADDNVVPIFNNVIPGYGRVGANGALAAPFTVNKTVEGDQRAAGVAVSSTGDIVFVWDGNSDRSVKHDPFTGAEIVDKHNIMYRRITVPKDTSAPFVTDVVAAAKNDKGEYNLTQILESTTLEKAPNTLIVTMSEEMFHQNRILAWSILTPSNWSLYRNGQLLTDGIVKAEIRWGRSEASDLIGYETGKWEVVLTLKNDLPDGRYTLMLSSVVEDVNKNRLDGTYNGMSSANFLRTFFINSAVVDDDDGGCGGGSITDDLQPIDPYDPRNPSVDPRAFTDMNARPAVDRNALDRSKPAIAYHPDGAFVVVAVENQNIFDPTTGAIVSTQLDIIARLYDKNGNPNGYERVVNDYIPGDQTDPHVSIDRFGNFVVVWSGPNRFAGSSGINARVFDKFGNAAGPSFQLSTLDVLQKTPKVALNGDGTFVVTWIGYDNATRGQVVFCRAFSFGGNPIGDTFIIGEVDGNHCYEIDLVTNGDGTYGVTWSAYNPATKNSDIFAQTFRVDPFTGKYTPLVNTFCVNTYTERDQGKPSIAMSDSGNFVITWEGPGQDVNNTKVTGFEIFARAFRADGSSIALPGYTTSSKGEAMIVNTTADARINKNAVNNQVSSSVAISNDGSTIAFTWTSYDQEFYNYDSINKVVLHDYGVYARVLKNFGKGFEDVPPTLPDQLKVEGEFQVNRVQIGNQVCPVIGMGRSGIFSIAWVGPVVGTSLRTDVFLRSYRPNVSQNISTSTPGFSATSLSEKRDGLSLISSTHVRPSGGGYMNEAAAPALVSTVFVINGTSGNDVLTVTPGAASGSWNVQLNGKTQNIPKGTTEIVFNGGAGKNEVNITGTAGRDDAVLNATTQTLVFAGAGLTFRATQVTTANLDGAGGNDSIQITTSKGNDVLDLSVGSLILSGTGLSSVAKNFEWVNVLSGGGKDVAIMRTSREDDDYLELAPNHAIMTGKGYTHEVTGFHSISAFSEGGNDTAVFTGSRFNDVLTANENNVILRGGNDAYFNRASGFRDVTVNGIGTGNSATVNGSRYGSDHLTVSENGVEMRYNNSYSLNFNGFQNATFNAGNGFSSALLTGGNRFVGYDDYCTYVSGNLTMTLNRFDSTVVHGTLGASSQAVLNVGGNVTASIKTLGRTTTLNANGTDLYSLIAFDQVYARKAQGNTGRIESTADYLFATGDWE